MAGPVKVLVAADLVAVPEQVELPEGLLRGHPEIGEEGIEALAKGLNKFEGTLLFVSHNRWFVNRLATRIVEISTDGVFDFQGTYDEYVTHKRADHLDVAAVLSTEAEARRKTKREKKRRKSKGS